MEGLGGHLLEISGPPEISKKEPQQDGTGDGGLENPRKGAEAERSFHSSVLESVLDSVQSNLPSDSDRQFACPFIKHDPEAYRYVINDCVFTGYDTISQLRNHIKRVHMLRYGCQQCGSRFPGIESNLERWRKGHKCRYTRRIRPQPTAEIMTKEQDEAFLGLDFRSRKLTDEDAWRTIFMTLWPETPEEGIPDGFKHRASFFSMDEIESGIAGIEPFRRTNYLPSPDIAFSEVENRADPTVSATTVRMPVPVRHDRVTGTIHPLVRGPSGSSHAPIFLTFNQLTQPHDESISTTTSFQTTVRSNDTASLLVSTASTSAPESSDPLIGGESTRPAIERKDDDICSLDSDPNEIGSQASIETTYEARSGKALLGLFLAEDQSINEACTEALSRMDRQRLIQNLRRLLKSFYKDLLAEAQSTTENSTARLLKGRPGRLRISGQIVDRIRRENAEKQGRDDGELAISREGKMRAEKWLSQADAALGQPLYDHSSSDNPDDEDEGTEDYFPLTAGYRAHLRESKALQRLQRDLFLIFLPDDIRDVFWTVPSNDVWISKKQDLSMVNQAKGWVEEATQLRWNWWPLTPRKRILQAGESRLFWKCRCGKTLWKDVSEEHSRWAERIISLPHLPPPRKSSCATREKRPSRIPSLLDILQKFPLVNNLPPMPPVPQRYVPENGIEMTSVLQPQPVWNPGNNLEHAAEYQASRERPSEQSPAPPTQSFFWILLGVDGATRTIVPAQIYVDEWTTDSHFFMELKKAYWKYRGWLRSWFSIWRLQYCEVVKFHRFAANRMVREYCDLPIQEEYKYAPRVPHAKNPPISSHVFETFFYSCDLDCSWKLSHDCIQCPNDTSNLTRIPKRHRSFTKDKTSEIWGLHTVHDPSFAYVVAYHLFMLTGPFLFFALWLKAYPNDLQNASVPVTVVAGLLSLFWATSGIIPSRERNLER